MKFQSGESIIHRLHPAVKLAWLLWITVAVFVFAPATMCGYQTTSGWPALVAAAIPLFAAAGMAVFLWLADVAPWRIPGIRLWVSLGTAILVLHILATRQGDQVFGPVTVGGLAVGIRAMGRLLAVILASALFVITTDPVSLACALMRVGLPYRWGFTLVTALRLAPIFRLEAHHVYQAQLVRGVAYDSGGPRRWWLMLRHLCFPLVVSAMRTAHSLSLSMEGRAFGLHRQRTYMREVVVNRGDVVAGGLLAVTIVLVAWYGFIRG
jgi:energy-coupling factor transport system permease protein